MNQETSNVQSGAAVAWSALLGGDQCENKDIKGWWWLWCDGQWCPAWCEHRDGWSGPRLDVAWLRPSGGMSRDSIFPDEAANEKWGGRIQPPNDRR